MQAQVQLQQQLLQMPMHVMTCCELPTGASCSSCWPLSDDYLMLLTIQSAENQTWLEAFCAHCLPEHT